MEQIERDANRYKTMHQEEQAKVDRDSIKRNEAIR